jgi:hypothetical protein
VEQLGEVDWPPVLRRLIWFQDLGLGYYPVSPADEPYDQAYFDKYSGYAETDQGRALTASRIAFVDSMWRGEVVDVGIGCGAFVEARPYTFGYDINPAGVAWLHGKDRYWNPYTDPCFAVTMWDVLEHLADFPALLKNVSRYCFMCLPLFDNAADALGSRHFRPTEHRWYFTFSGLQREMAGLGWTLVTFNQDESDFHGRHQITTLAFRRQDAVA